MSSPSTKRAESRCPECGRDVLRVVLRSETFVVEGQEVRVEDLMPDECPTCKSLVWPESELGRARRAARLKREQAA